MIQFDFRITGNNIDSHLKTVKEIISTYNPIPKIIEKDLGNKIHVTINFHNQNQHEKFIETINKLKIGFNRDV